MTQNDKRYFPHKSKFSKTQAELAASIENDIAEDIDNGEDRQTLRMAVHYWACHASDLAIKLQLNEDTKVIRELQKLQKQLDKKLYGREEK